MNALILIGLAVFLGTISGKIFQKLKIPQVVGYIIFGTLIGKSFLHLLEGPGLESFSPVVNLTLGIIGFIIGGELKKDVFKKYGRSIYTILFSQGLLTFILVTAVVTLVTRKLYLGLFLGAIATATDPASTTSVLWEYKSKGPLTTTLTSIVALDDALAIVIYGLAKVFAQSMILKEGFSFMHSIVDPVSELLQCIVLGLITGYALVKLISRIREKDVALSIIFGIIALVVGLSMYLHIDLILSTMVFGMTVANLIPKKSEQFFKSVKEMSSSLYIFFFVVVGAQLDIHIFMKMSVLGLMLSCLFSRAAGKIFGSMLGGVFVKARKNVSNYMGYCLLPQGGVAMGLALSISHSLMSAGEEGRQIGLLVMNIAVATTFIVQLIGPSLVRWSVIKSDEAYRDITQDDIIDSYKVKDVMQKDFTIIPENTPLKQIIKTVKEKETSHFPVVNGQNKLTGSVSLNELKSALLEEQLYGIVLAGDIAASIQDVAYANQPLKEAIEILEKKSLDCLPVLDEEEGSQVVGLLEYRPLLELLNRKLLERHQGINGEFAST